jgi:uncharacterized membrane protein
MPLKDSWLFPAIQSIHLAGIALLVGSTVMLDLRALGLVLDRHSSPEVAKRFTPWSRTGLAILLITGPVLFASNVPRYVNNPAFVFKMIVLILALIVHFTMRHMAEKHGRLVAIVSIVLWTCVVLGGRAIADFDI